MNSYSAADLWQLFIVVTVRRLTVEVFQMRASLAMALFSSLLVSTGIPSMAADKEASAGTAAAVGAERPADAAKSSTPSANSSAPAPVSTTPTSANEPASSAAIDAQHKGSPAGASTAPSAETTSDAAPTANADAAALEPHKRPVPGGYAAAAELFKQRKFAQAQKEFEAIVASGTADINTHLCLAHCYLQQKIYTKAVKEFEILSKYAKNSMSLQKSCAATATSLRNAMRGICPANCLKGHDPRWTLKAGNKVIQVPHNGGGYDTLTPNDIGHLIVYEHGNAVVKGVCPVCEGTTQVPVLKDGGPMPRL